MDFSSTGAMRSPFSPRVRQSITGRRPIGLSSAKKNQNKFMQTPDEPSGDVVYKTPLTTLETYGTPLPVMVTEALTFASGDVSVRLSPCGWCWVVSGRRVLCWAGNAPTPGVSSPAPSTAHAARELTLPQTDLAHKADLVVLFYEDGAQMPSCIGVSPEGMVRYWPSVGQEGAYVDVSCELAGQECERLGECEQDGLLLATTTCTLVLLNPTVVDGRPTVTCKTFRPPSGWLGGIGRRVSLLFFGSMPAHVDTKLVGVAALEGGAALVCGGPALQLWRGAELHEHDLRRALAAPLARTHPPPHGDPSSLEVMALDVRASGPRALLLLVASVNVARSPEMRYAIAHINVEEADAPRVVSLAALRGWPAPAPAPGPGAPAPAPGAAPRFLPLPRAALLYTPGYVAIVSMSGGRADVVDVAGEGDRLLAAELCGGRALLFTAQHGVLALSTRDPAAAGDAADDAHASLCESPTGSPCPSDMYDGNLSLYEIDPHEVSLVTTDACGKLKTAFLFHLRRDVTSCRRLVDELFPAPAAPAAPAEPLQRDVDSVLDRTVLRIATEMLDDVPAGDPRWRRRAGPATSVALGSSAALQVAAQLQDKQRAFCLFVEFLRAQGLWQRLGLVTDEAGGGCARTAGALAALGERLAAAAALRRLQRGPDAPLIDAALYQVACGSDAGDGSDSDSDSEEVSAALAAGALAPADVCYRRVSRAARLLRALARAAAAPRGAAEPAAAAAARHAATINIINSVLREVNKWRARWQAGEGEAAQGEVGATPALAAALLPALADLHKRAITEYARRCDEPGARGAVYAAAAGLADLLLAAARHLPPHQYCRLRRDLIQPYVDEGQTERAAVLAEKFKDFELLIEMCMQADDMDGLYGYIDKYEDEGAAELAFAWLAERGGRGARVLVQALGPRYAARLRGWLRAAPARAPLLALQHLAAAELAPAAAALHQLAATEADSRCRMTTMASLAKLCLVASDDPEVHGSDLWQKIESRLSLAELQAGLPRDIKLHNGLDADDTRVFTPEELVQMYIESESPALSEYDYKKALDLTDYIHDMERRDELRLRVWCACIARDSWAGPGAGEGAGELPARDQLLDNKFFRLVDLVHIMGGDLELLLPPLDDILTAPELAELVSDPQFHYTIKYGYECVDTTRNDVNMLEG